MRLAWYADLASQAILAGLMALAGRRDWWLAYLAYGVLRDLFLMTQYYPGNGHFYWWCWSITELITIAIGIAAVGQTIQGNPRWLTQVSTIVACSLCLAMLILTPTEYPVLRRASLFSDQALAYGGYATLAVPLIYRQGTTSIAMLGYFILLAARDTAAEMFHGIPATDMISLWHMRLEFTLFVGCSIHLALNRNKSRPESRILSF